MLCGRQTPYIVLLTNLAILKSTTVMSATTSDSEVSGANNELQAAIRSVILMKTVLSELLRSNVKTRSH